MFQETCSHKEENNKKLIDATRAIELRNKLHKLLMMLAKSNIKYKIVEENEMVNLKNRPTIYVLNHYSAQDTPIACEILNERAYILAGVQNLGLIDNLFFWLNGSIFVDRKSKEDMALSKSAMIQYLKKNIPLIYFPEGTWNLSDNLLMLNMKWGIIDVASETNAQIIPINLDYDRENMICSVKYGEPFLTENYADKKEAITMLRDRMATMRWESIEKNIPLCRRATDLEYYRKLNKISIEEFSKIDMEYEDSIIYKPDPLPGEVFEPIKRMKITKANAFMFSKHNKGI